VDEVIGIPTHLDFFAKAKSSAPLSSSVNKITQIACGGLHTAVVTKEGELFTWGSTEGGQLGHEITDEPSVKRPTRVEYLAERGLKIS
jgi:alpha-tubulin suppressor-like RCC1 family protein